MTARILPEDIKEKGSHLHAMCHGDGASAIATAPDRCLACRSVQAEKCRKYSSQAFQARRHCMDSVKATVGGKLIPKQFK